LKVPRVRFHLGSLMALIAVVAVGLAVPTIPLALAFCAILLASSVVLAIGLGFLIIGLELLGARVVSMIWPRGSQVAEPYDEDRDGSCGDAG